LWPGVVAWRVRGGEAEAGRDRGDEAAARGGALGVNRRGAAGNVGKIEGYGKNRRESGGVAAKGARAAGAPDRILPHKGRHGSAGSFIGLAHASA
jgi:hypothetical protein